MDPVGGYHIPHSLMHCQCDARQVWPIPSGPHNTAISGRAEGRRLSWPKWLVTYRDGITMLVLTVVESNVVDTTHRR